MELIIRTQEHTEHEIILNHKLSFSSINGDEITKNKEVNNIITAIEDLNGFTTLAAIIRELNLSKDSIQNDVYGCNQLNKARLINVGVSYIFLIPKSIEYSLNKFPEYYISELIKVGDYLDSNSVHLTYYSFIQSFPKEEIIRQMILLLNPVLVPSINQFYWEIDSRYINEIIESYKFVIEKIYRREPKSIRIVSAKKFKIQYETSIGNVEIGYLKKEDN